MSKYYQQGGILAWTVLSYCHGRFDSRTFVLLATIKHCMTLAVYYSLTVIFLLALLSLQQECLLLSVFPVPFYFRLPLHIASHYSRSFLLCVVRRTTITTKSILRSVVLGNHRGR